MQTLSQLLLRLRFPNSNLQSEFKAQPGQLSEALFKTKAREMTSEWDQTCHQNWWPEFNPRTHTVEWQNWILPGCPLTYIHTRATACKNSNKSIFETVLFMLMIRMEKVKETQLCHWFYFKNPQKISKREEFFMGMDKVAWSVTVLV